MEKTEKKKKLRIILKVLKKTITLRHLFLIILLLAVNTFAWFIYANRVSNDITVKVRSWKILLFNDGETITDYVDMKIDSLYPGMDDYEDTLEVYNLGEVNAEAQYTLLEATIFGENIKTQEYYTDRGEDYPDDAISSETLETLLSTGLPFKINFSMTNNTVESETGLVYYGVTATWPYESGDDALDTSIGTQAYTFSSEHPGESSIVIKAKVTVEQVNS